MLSSCNDRSEKVVLPQQVNLKTDNTKEKSKSGRVNVIIFEVSVGRASQGCLHGWGFCNFHWFPEFNKSQILADNQKVVELLDDGFYIYSETEVDPLTSKIAPLIVDEDITTNYEENGFSKSVTIAKGSYFFDYNIGENGGYFITVK